jgi:hypothetical protein
MHGTQAARMDFAAAAGGAVGHAADPPAMASHSIGQPIASVRLLISAAALPRNGR